jgi:hypothetical protein
MFKNYVHKNLITLQLEFWNNEFATMMQLSHENMNN